jgi:hypothetical protein
LDWAERLDPITNEWTLVDNACLPLQTSTTPTTSKVSWVGGGARNRPAIGAAVTCAMDHQSNSIIALNINGWSYYQPSSSWPPSVSDNKNQPNEPKSGSNGRSGNNNNNKSITAADNDTYFYDNMNADYDRPISWRPLSHLQSPLSGIHQFGMTCFHGHCYIAGGRVVDETVVRPIRSCYIRCIRNDVSDTATRSTPGGTRQPPQLSVPKNEQSTNGWTSLPLLPSPISAPICIVV